MGIILRMKGQFTKNIKLPHSYTSLYSLIMKQENLKNNLTTHSEAC